MAKVWLTYAWNDNVNQDVDHIIAELKSVGLEVAFDRAELLAGQRLWQQIDAAMNDPSVNGWAMLVTEDSLRSEPCQEEIAYALDRALRTGRRDFPLIGIFPRPIDRSLIPSALATRLYVDLTSRDWKEQIRDGVAGRKSARDDPPPSSYGAQLHDLGSGLVLEVWPRSGRWYPFVGAVPDAEADKLSAVTSQPRGHTDRSGMTIGVGKGSSNGWSFERINHVVDANNSGFLYLSEIPSSVCFGEEGSYNLLTREDIEAL